MTETMLKNKDKHNNLYMYCLLFCIRLANVTFNSTFCSYNFNAKLILRELYSVWSVNNNLKDGSHMCSEVISAWTI